MLVRVRMVLRTTMIRKVNSTNLFTIGVELPGLSVLLTGVLALSRTQLAMFPAGCLWIGRGVTATVFSEAVRRRSSVLRTILRSKQGPTQTPHGCPRPTQCR